MIVWTTLYNSLDGPPRCALAQRCPHSAWRSAYPRADLQVVRHNWHGVGAGAVSARARPASLYAASVNRAGQSRSETRVCSCCCCCFCRSTRSEPNTMPPASSVKIEKIFSASVLGVTSPYLVDAQKRRQKNSQWICLAPQVDACVGQREWAIQTKLALHCFLEHPSETAQICEPASKAKPESRGWKHARFRPSPPGGRALGGFLQGRDGLTQRW